MRVQEAGPSDCGFLIADCRMKNQKYWMMDARYDIRDLYKFLSSILPVVKSNGASSATE